MATHEESEVVAARILITPALEVRILTQRFKGRVFLHVREFALTADNVFVATPRGISVPVHMLGDVLEAVRALRAGSKCDEVVAQVALGGGRQIQFAITTWQGITKGDIRLYYSSGASKDLTPTKKGLRLNLALLREVERGLEALERQLAD